jgi:outer membrane protein OmpA-like peptidoglycan-associated protein
VQQRPANQPVQQQQLNNRQNNRDQRQDARQERREDRRIDALRAERKETKQGNQTVIRERDRTIVRQGNRAIIRHDDDTRFRRSGANEQVVRRGNRTERVIQRPNGVRVVTTVDANGRVIRRSRFVNGREYVLFRNRPSSGFNFIINVPPPVIHIPRERYIVEYRDAPPALIYDTLIAPPVMDLDRRFSMDEVLYNYDVRARMPRIDIDSITFDTGSWDIRPDQAAKLEPIAQAMMRAIQANPNEVYLIEGHTDAVGNEDDNLSLSDRRAQAVTEVLTEEFGVPPENMTPQGYGEQNLKVPTQGPDERNRYVSVRRVTPLLAQQQ